MPLRRSQGTLRAEPHQHDELPKVDPAAIAAPANDPVTGRFRRGNKASRRRKLIRTARALPWLDETRCEPWLVPYVRAAKEHAVRLLEALPVDDPLLAGLAEEVAAVRVVARALLSLGLEGDALALDASAKWFREARQGALSLRGLASGVEPADGDDLAKRKAAFQRQLAEQPAIDATPGGEKP